MFFTLYFRIDDSSKPIVSISNDKQKLLKNLKTIESKEIKSKDVLFQLPETVNPIVINPPVLSDNQSESDMLRDRCLKAVNKRKQLEAKLDQLSNTSDKVKRSKMTEVNICRLSVINMFYTNICFFKKL